MKGNRNINRGLRFSTISNRDNSNRDNPRLDNHDSNNIDRRFSNPNNSVLNPRANDPGESHNTHSLKENLKEGIKNMESRMITGLKTLLPIISVG